MSTVNQIRQPTLFPLRHLMCYQLTHLSQRVKINKVWLDLDVLLASLMKGNIFLICLISLSTIFCRKKNNFDQIISRNTERSHGDRLSFLIRN